MSLFKITYLKDILPNSLLIINDPEFTIQKSNDLLEWKLFLNKLEEDFDKIYVVTLEFVKEFDFFNEDAPRIFLSDPILVTKNSNPDVLSKFASDRVIYFCNQFDFDSHLINYDQITERYLDSGVIVKYKEIIVF